MSTIVLVFLPLIDHDCYYAKVNDKLLVIEQIPVMVNENGSVVVSVSLEKISPYKSSGILITTSGWFVSFFIQDEVRTAIKFRHFDSGIREVVQPRQKMIGDAPLERFPGVISFKSAYNNIWIPDRPRRLQYSEAFQTEKYVLNGSYGCSCDECKKVGAEI